MRLPPQSYFLKKNRIVHFIAVITCSTDLTGPGHCTPSSGTRFFGQARPVCKHTHTSLLALYWDNAGPTARKLQTNVEAFISSRKYLSIPCPGIAEHVLSISVGGVHYNLFAGGQCDLDCSCEESRVARFGFLRAEKPICPFF